MNIYTSGSKGAVPRDYRGVSCTKDGVGGEGLGNLRLRHRAAVLGDCHWNRLVLFGEHRELVPSSPTVVRGLVPR